MAQPLRILTALLEEKNVQFSAPSLSRQYTTGCLTLVPGSLVPSTGLYRHRLACVHIHTHIHNLKKKNFFIITFADLKMLLLSDYFHLTKNKNVLPFQNNGNSFCDSVFS